MRVPKQWPIVSSTLSMNVVDGKRITACASASAIGTSRAVDSQSVAAARPVLQAAATSLLRSPEESGATVLQIAFLAMLAATIVPFLRRRRRHDLAAFASLLAPGKVLMPLADGALLDAGLAPSGLFDCTPTGAAAPFADAALAPIAAYGSSARRFPCCTA